MNKHFFLQSPSFELAIKPSDSKHDLDMKRTETETWKGLNWYFPKDAHQKSKGVSEARLKKTRLLYLGNVEKPPDPQFLCNGRLRVK